MITNYLCKLFYFNLYRNSFWKILLLKNVCIQEDAEEEIKEMKVTENLKETQYNLIYLL